jgi:hypothetical protein
MFRIAKSKTESSGILQTGARICKRLRSPEIASKISIPPAYVARQANTTTLFDVPAYQATVHWLAESIPGLIKAFTNSG